MPADFRPASTTSRVILQVEKATLNQVYQHQLIPLCLVGPGLPLHVLWQ
jgi:hypothetical protein